MDLKDVFDKRFSVRRYTDEKVDRSLINQILDAGRICPTAANQQPQRFYVLESDRALDKLDNVTRMRFGAPVVILVCCDMNEVWYNGMEEGYNTSEMDCSISTTYMMLKATDLGLGTVWVRAFNSEEVQKEFRLPKNIKPVCMMALGYKSEQNDPHNAAHLTRNKLNKIAKYL